MVEDGEEETAELLVGGDLSGEPRRDGGVRRRRRGAPSEHEEEERKKKSTDGFAVKPLEF